MKSPKKLHIFSFTPTGRKLASKVKKEIKRDFQSVKVPAAAKLKDGGLKREVGEIFKEGSGDLIFISAAGIAVRSIAPFLKGKDRDPAVLLIDEKGEFVISLLSGHLGGANELTKLIAKRIKARPVITTATDLAGLPSIEELTKKFDFAIEDIKKIKYINSAIIKGGQVVIADKDPKRLAAMKKAYKKTNVFKFQKTVPRRLKKGDALAIVSFDSTLKAPKAALLLRPREFVVGVGCKKGVTIKEVEAAISKTLLAKRVSPLSIKTVASVDIKKTEAGILKFAEKYNMLTEFVSKTRLSKITLPSGPSKAVIKKLGIGGVAEPAALIVSGAVKLWIKKKIHKRITVALAKVASRS